MKETTAIARITETMKALTPSARARVLRYVADWIDEQAKVESEVAQFVNGEEKAAASVGDGTAKG